MRDRRVKRWHGKVRRVSDKRVRYRREGDKSKEINEFEWQYNYIGVRDIGIKEWKLVWVTME